MHGRGARRRPDRQDHERRPGEGRRRRSCSASDFGAGWRRRADQAEPADAARTAPASTRRSPISSSPGHADARFTFQRGAVELDQDVAGARESREAVQTDFARTISPQLGRASAYQLEQARRTSIDVSVAQVPFPPTGTVSAVYRAMLDVATRAGRRVSCSTDYVFFGEGRVEYEFTVIAPVGAGDQLRSSSSGSPRSCCSARRRAGMRRLARPGGRGAASRRSSSARGRGRRLDRPEDEDHEGRPGARGGLGAPVQRPRPGLERAAREAELAQDPDLPRQPAELLRPDAHRPRRVRALELAERGRCRSTPTSRSSRPPAQVATLVQADGQPAARTLPQVRPR